MGSKREGAAPQLSAKRRKLNFKSPAILKITSLDHELVSRQMMRDEARNE